MGGDGADTYVVDGPASLATLALGADDRLVIDGSVGSAAGDVLTVDSASLGGTLQVTGGLADAGTFLVFGTAAGDFDTFRGLDLGDGAYLRPVLGATATGSCRPSLPGGMTVQFPTAAAADDFFAQLSGKRPPSPPGPRSSSTCSTTGSPAR